MNQVDYIKFQNYQRKKITVTVMIEAGDELPPL